VQSDRQSEVGDELPREVRELIRDHIHSLEQLDLLLFLHGRPGQSLSMPEAMQALGSTHALASATLTHLRQQGLAEVARDFAATRYAPANEALHQRVGLLAESYREARTAVLTFISACALERVRDAQGRAFAHAYLGRGSKKE
jgi:hypothetical protein